MAFSFIIIGLIILAAIRIWQLAYPRPYPGIPHKQNAARSILGDLPDLLRAIKTTKDPAIFVFEQCRKLGLPVIQLFIRPFSHPFIFIDDVYEVEDILSARTKDFDRSMTTSVLFKPFVPHASIVKVTDSKWRAQRKLWMDVMHPDFLRRVSLPKIHRSALELADLLKTKASIADGRPFFVEEDFELACFDAIWATTLGSGLDSVANELTGTHNGATAIQQPQSRDAPALMPSVARGQMWLAQAYFHRTIEKIIFLPLLELHHWILRQFPAYKRHWVTKNRIVDSLIKSARERFAHLSAKQLAERQDTCAMDLVLSQERAFKLKPEDSDISPPTYEEIHDELFLFLMAGHQTTATTLSWAAKFLTNNPTQQSRLRSALLAAFPSSKPTPEQILQANIPYLDATLEESVRLANIVPRLVRAATADTEVLGYRIHKGAFVNCNAFVSRPPMESVRDEVRSERSRRQKGRESEEGWGVDMGEFRPERWVDGEGRFEPRRLPRLGFSLGVRGCFGQKLAMLELRVLIVLLVLNFRFEPIPDALNSPAGRQKALRVPQQCFVRLSVL